MTRASYNSRPGNRSAEKHGGRGAEQALAQKREFTGLARDKLIEVQAEYGERGPLGMLERNALNSQVCADLFMAALEGAAQDKDMKLLLTYAIHMNTHTCSANRAYLALHEARKHADPETIDLSEYRQEDKTDAQDS